MELTLDDIRRLYGEFIYVIPEPGTETSTPKTAAHSKESVVIPPEKVAETPVASEKPTTPSPSGDSASKPGIVWKPKENSKVLFVLHPDEFKTKKLTNLLKDIVAAMKIPFEDAGFGTIEGQVGPLDWQAMPNPFAVIFDLELNRSGENPIELDGKKVYFAAKLAELEANRTLKMDLWKRLQEIMSEM